MHPSPRYGNEAVIPIPPASRRLGINATLTERRQDLTYLYFSLSLYFLSSIIFIDLLTKATLSPYSSSFGRICAANDVCLSTFTSADLSIMITMVVCGLDDDDQLIISTCNLSILGPIRSKYIIRSVHFYIHLGRSQNYDHNGLTRSGRSVNHSHVYVHVYYRPL